MRLMVFILRGSNTSSARIAKPPELRALALRGMEFAKCQGKWPLQEQLEGASGLLQEDVNTAVAAMSSHFGSGISLKALRMSLQDRLGINLVVQKAQIRTMVEQALVMLTAVWESDPRPDGRGRCLFTELHWQDELSITRRWRGEWEPLRECLRKDAGNYGEPSGIIAYDAAQVSALSGASESTYSGLSNWLSCRSGVVCHDARLLVHKDTCNYNRVLEHESGDMESLYGGAEVEASSSGSKTTVTLMCYYGWNPLLFSDGSLLMGESCLYTKAAAGRPALTSTIGMLRADGLIDSGWGHGGAGVAFDPGGCIPQ